MFRQRLIIKSRDEVDVIGELLWNRGEVEIVRSNDTIRPFFERIIKYGIEDWHGPFSEASFSHTPSDSQLFLERLKCHLTRQSGFVMTLLYE